MSTDHSRKSLPKRVTDLLDASLTPRLVAQCLGVEPAAINEWSTGQTKPTRDHMDVLDLLRTVISRCNAEWMVNPGTETIAQSFLDNPRREFREFISPAQLLLELSAALERETHVPTKDRILIETIRNIGLALDQSCPNTIPNPRIWWGSPDFYLLRGSHRILGLD